MKKRAFLTAYSGWLLLAVLLLLGASAGYINWSQLNPVYKHGTGSKGQSSDGTGTSQHIPKFDANGNVVEGYPVQGSDTNLLTAGTVSGAAQNLCTDANGGATTAGCPSGSGGGFAQTDQFHIVTTPPAAGSWTWVTGSQGTATLGTYLNLDAPIDTGTLANRMVYQALSSSPYTIIAEIAGNGYNVNQCAWMIFVRQSSGGNWISLDYGSISSMPNIRFASHTSVTGGGTLISGSNPNNGAQAIFPSNIVWLKLQDDGTNLNAFVSWPYTDWQLFAQILDQPLPAPSSAPVAGTPTSSGSCTAGSHTFEVTYTSATGETTPGPASNSVTCVTTTGQTVPLSSIPLGPTGTITRNIYMTKAGGGTYYLAKSVGDNTTTTANVTTADGSLVTAAPSTNTSGFLTSGATQAGWAVRSNSYYVTSATLLSWNITYP